MAKSYSPFDIRVLECYVCMAERWWWDDVHVLGLSSVHADIELFHLLNCALKTVSELP